MFAAMIVPSISEKLPKRLQFAICFTVAGLCFGLMGPSRLLGLPSSLVLIESGFAILGGILVFGFIPCLPEAID